MVRGSDPARPLAGPHRSPVRDDARPVARASQCAAVVLLTRFSRAARAEADAVGMFAGRCPNRARVDNPRLIRLPSSVGKVVSRPKFAEQISVEVGEQNVIFTGIIFFSKYGKQN